MQPLQDLLDSIYSQAEGDPAAIEKTAEARLFDALNEDQSGEVHEDPLDALSLEELTKLASEHGIEVDENPNPGVDEEAMQKAAFDTLGGQVMAHATFNELNLIKVALANGFCRVCKENPLDTQGLSICSACNS